MPAPSANDSKRPSASAALDLAPYTDKDQEIADAETSVKAFYTVSFEHRFEVPNENRKYNGGAQDVVCIPHKAGRPSVAEPGEDEAEREQDELAHHGPEEESLCLVRPSTMNVRWQA